MGGIMEFSQDLIQPRSISEWYNNSMLSTGVTGLSNVIYGIALVGTALFVLFWIAYSLILLFVVYHRDDFDGTKGRRSNRSIHSPLHGNSIEDSNPMMNLWTRITEAIHQQTRAFEDEDC